MKFLKRPLMFLGAIPFIVGCAKSSIYGTYGFQMGKETGTHFGIFLTLKNEAFPTVENAQKFEFTANVKNGQDETDSSELLELLDFLKDPDTGNVMVPGYYKMTNEKNKNQEKRMILGIDFDYLKNKAKEYMTKNYGEDVPIDIDDIDLSKIKDSNIIENLLYTTYKDSLVNVYVPVSFSDAYYQLYWYGIDVKIKFDIESEEPITIDVINLETRHDYGTLPTKDDVIEINKTFPNDHKGCLIEEFKQFHQVKMGLIKQ